MSQNGKTQESATSKKTKDKTEKIVNDLKKKGKLLLDQGLESARGVYDEQSTVVKKKVGELQDKSLDEISEDVKVYVRRNPFKSMGIALGVGAFLALLFKSDD